MRRAIALVGCAVGVVLLGAAGVTGGAAYLDESERLNAWRLPSKGEFKTAYWQERYAEFRAEFGDWPDLVPYTPEERETARAWEARYFRETTLAQFPAIPLPEVAFEAYDDAARATCLADAGVTVVVDAWGLPVGMSGTAETATVLYTCYVRFPVEPHIRPPDRTIRFAWEYWTGFLAPCFEAHRIPQTAPPSEDEFFATYPRQGWGPAYPDPWDDDVDPGWTLACGG